jgi:hypothetical protein
MNASSNTALQAYRNSPEARTGCCDWCKTEQTDLSYHRDFEEGMTGPMYRVCGGCRRKENYRLTEEINEDSNTGFDDGYGFDEGYDGHP